MQGDSAPMLYLVSAYESGSFLEMRKRSKRSAVRCAATVAVPASAPNSLCTALDGSGPLSKPRLKRERAVVVVEAEALSLSALTSAKIGSRMANSRGRASTSGPLPPATRA